MSFNRFNRNVGNRTPSSSFTPPYQASNLRLTNISPWEGGVVPGNTRPSSSQGLLSLPTSQMQQTSSNLLAAQQLVMASNLLSSLGMNVLPNQQQQQQQRMMQFQQPQQRQDNLPSLLRLGRSAMDMMGNSQSSFRQQGQDNYRFNNLPSDRFRGMDSMRNKMQQNNMNSNRNEPYQKNRAHQPTPKPQVRRPFVNKPLNKQGSTALPGAANQKPKFRKPIVKLTESSESATKEEEVETKSVAKTDEEAKISPSDGDLAKREDEEDGVAKRDWKDEKNEDGAEKGPDPLPVPAPADAGTEAGAEQEVNDVDMTAEVKVKEEEAPKTSIVFHCHICNENMIDENLLKEHVLLESHKTLMAKTAESYHAQAAALRLNMQEAIGRLDVMAGKRTHRQAQHREYCKMCKLNFIGTIANHRKLKDHLQLKTFLHPRCVVCSKEFTTRIDWDVHKLGAAHQVLEQTTRALQKPKSTSHKAEKLGAKEEAVNGAEHKVYQPNRVYGMRFLSEGFFCRICEKFFEKRAESRAHFQTEEHFNVCVALEKKEAESASAAKSAELTIDPEVAVKVESTDDASLPIAEVDSDLMADAAADEPDDNEGNWKRPKRMKEDDDADVAAPTDESAAGIPIEHPEGDHPEGDHPEGDHPSEDVVGTEERLLASPEDEKMDGKEDGEGEEISAGGFLLEDDINMILDASGLDLASNKVAAGEEEIDLEVKASANKARRGGRGKGRKRN